MQTHARTFPATWPLMIMLLLSPLARAERAVQAWVQFYSGPGSGGANIDSPAAVVVDAGNNIIVTGYSMGNGTYNDYATIKYSSAGVPLWTNLYNGPVSGTDCACALAVDTGNNVIVTGFSDAGADLSGMALSSAAWAGMAQSIANAAPSANCCLMSMIISFAKVNACNS